MLTTILVILVVLIAALLIYAATRPDEFHRQPRDQHQGIARSRSFH